MNKRLIIAKHVLLTIGLIGVAHADNDFVHHSLFTNWTGFYAGVNAGVVFNNDQLKSQQLGFTNPSETCNSSSDFSAFSPGMQLGYLYQFSNFFVSGIEANASFNTQQNDTLNCTCPDNPNVSDRFSFTNQMQSSIKGRIGRTLNWQNNILLPYLTAGASFANVGLKYSNEGGDHYSNNTTAAGWLIGVGVEWAFKQDWSLRAEYSYVDYGNVIKLKIPSVYGLIDPNGKGRVDLSSNNVIVAINYWI